MEAQVLTQQPEFLWRRLLDMPPVWAVWVPVSFAVFVIYLIAVLRQEKKSLASLFAPVLALALALMGVFAGEAVANAFHSTFDWSVWLPVCLGATVVYLVVLFVKSPSMSGMLAPLLIGSALGVVYAVTGLRLMLALFSWWYLLVPTLAIALFYVAMMYLKDSRSVHPAVAGFLGFLRCLVYAILAVVFLLPGCQTFDMTEYNAKTLFLFDVSGSVVATVDDAPEIGQDPATLPTRQDKVIRFLTEGNKGFKPFLEQTLAKTPIAAYRFGSMLDESEIQSWKEGTVPSADALKLWLKPDKKNFKAPEGMAQEEADKLRAKYQDIVEGLLSGTNLGGSALQLAKLEGNGYLQSIVIVSDGQSNLGSDEALREFVNRMSGGKKKVPIFTVGVGEYRVPASIRVDDLQAPATARPDDKFPVRVPVVGSGLEGEEFNVFLEATRVKDSLGQPVAGEKTTLLGPMKGKFQGAGDNPQDTLEFEIDVAKLQGLENAGSDKEGVLEGTWQFVAKVPRSSREAYPKAEHVSDPPTEVLVQKRKLRVLLFAGGPTREYQFLRTLLYREVTEKRLDLSVLLQTGREDHVDQDVEAERYLKNFPNKIGPTEAGEKYMSLSDYDVIVAIDPDWLALDVNTFKLLNDWVGTHAGGMVFVGGPVHTFSLKRPAGVDISALQMLLPVYLDDSRLHSLEGIGHDVSRPYILNFTPAARNFEFLKLDESEDSPTAGWDKFFWEGGQRPATIKDAKPKRGFYNYYPVVKIKPDSSVIATFAGPNSSRINDGKDEQPFIVSMRFGSGKTMYIGSGETWRLRHAKDAYHERFWIKLCRFMGSSTTEQKKYGRMLMARTVPVGNVALEAQVKGKDLLPLPKEKLTVNVKRLDEHEGPPKKDQSFTINPKSTQGGWAGWFDGKIDLRVPGEYEFSIPIPGTNETLSQRVTVRKPNPELDNVRNNFGLLYQLASEAKDVVDPLPAETRRKVLGVLQPVLSTESQESKTAKMAPRLFFRLDQADAINECLRPLAPKREQVKGKLFDLWDKGVGSGLQVSSLHLAWGTPLLVGLLGGAILLLFGQYLFAGLFAGAGAVLATIPLIYNLAASPTWPVLPIEMSYVLVLVVSLLGIEWLVRKLLKLA